MPFVFPRHDQLMSSQRKLPAKDRQSKVLLEFSEPIPRRFCSEFQRIHLSRAMLAAAEEEFYEAKLFQPHRVRRRYCPACHQLMDMVSQNVSKCRNKACTIIAPDGRGEHPTSLFEFHSGPVRGVVFALTLAEFIVHRNAKECNGMTYTEERVDRCLLILDRRYDKRVLACVYRAANQVCEIYGWRLK